METSTALRDSRNGKKSFFGKLHFALRLFGVSLKDDESWTYKCYSIFLLFLVHFLYTIFDVIEMFKHDNETVVNMIIFPFAFVLGCAKVTMFIRNRAKLRRLLHKLEQEPFILNQDRGGVVEEKLINDCFWIINAQTLTIWMFALVSLAYGFIFTIIKRIKSSDYHDWEFPYGPLTIVNVTYSPNYEISWLYQNLCLIVMGFNYINVDLLIVAILAYVALQFKILQNNIRRIVDISYKEMLKETRPLSLLAASNSRNLSEVDASMVPWKYLKKSLVRAIKYHLAIINVVGEIEDLFSGLLLFILLNTLGIICFSIIHVIQTLNGLTQLAGGVLDVFVQTLATCFWAEQVMKESQEVGRAAFEANFVGADLRFQKSLVFIILRSQKPSVITARKFTVICLATFLWIVRTSYSAFTVLRHLKQ